MIMEECVMAKPFFSVVIPAHNEEKYTGKDQEAADQFYYDVR